MKTLSKDELKSAYRKVWNTDERMVDYCVKTSSANLQTDDGLVWDIDKPRIETNFCFGERGYDYDEVNKTCHELSKNEHYFKTENIRRNEAFQLIKNLSKYPDDAYWALNYSSSNIVVIRFYKSYDNIGISSAVRKMTTNEIEDVIELLRQEIKKFNKRLNTYLKRYGLSKCRYWTYWVDA